MKTVVRKISAALSCALVGCSSGVTLSDEAVLLVPNAQLIAKYVDPQGKWSQVHMEAIVEYPSFATSKSHLSRLRLAGWEACSASSSEWGRFLMSNSTIHRRLEHYAKDQRIVGISFEYRSSGIDNLVPDNKRLQILIRVDHHDKADANTLRRELKCPSTAGKPT
jgi:hypothetical protein